MPDSRPPKICDYEGSNYRTEFWEGQGRDYEDRVERVALRRMLPAQGRRILQIGAGFGRLTDELDAFDQVVLMDYSLSQLQYAQEHFGKSERYTYVAADVYRLPFGAGVFDGTEMIRVLHHLADVPSALAQIRRILTTDATFILEFANKRNLKAMIRYTLNKQAWSPYTQDPVEFVELNFDFHPKYVHTALTQAGFRQEMQIPVSFFRMGVLKRNVPTGLLVGLDSLLQRTGILYTPSIFTKNIAIGESPNRLDADSIFACPETGEPLKREGDTMVCPTSRLRYAIRDGIYDFKAPLDALGDS